MSFVTSTGADAVPAPIADAAATIAAATNTATVATISNFLRMMLSPLAE